MFRNVNPITGSGVSMPYGQDFLTTPTLSESSIYRSSNLNGYEISKILETQNSLRSENLELREEIQNIRLQIKKVNKANLKYLEKEKNEALSVVEEARKKADSNLAIMAIFLTLATFISGNFILFTNLHNLKDALIFMGLFTLFCIILVSFFLTVLSDKTFKAAKWLLLASSALLFLCCVLFCFVLSDFKKIEFNSANESTCSEFCKDDTLKTN